MVSSQAKFFFKQINVHAAKQVIKVLPLNEATIVEIPIKIFKESRFTFE